MKTNIIGYLVYSYKLDLLLGDIFKSLESSSTEKKQPPKWLACINPHSYYLAKNSAVFRIALNAADWIIPDGIGVVLASRILGGDIKNRITGYDIFSELTKIMNDRGTYRVFFLGSDEKTLELINERMSADYPNVHVAGTYSPPFREIWTEKETKLMIDAVNSSSADVLWVGMTAPKQEKWINENLPALDIRFAAAIGAVFDFYAGNVSRGNRVIRQLGLEWLVRLTQQPKRLWRRTFVSAPTFLIDVLRAAFLSKAKKVKMTISSLTDKS